jgi:DNA-binding MarR family transcriptional regulator
LLQEKGTNEADDGLVGKMPTTSLRRLISLLRRSSGLCCTAEPGVGPGSLCGRARRLRLHPIRLANFGARGRARSATRRHYARPVGLVKGRANLGGDRGALTVCIYTAINDPMPARSRLTLCNCFAVRQASRHVTKIYDRHLAPARITIVQFTLLALLDERSEMTMNDLVKAVMIDRTTLVRTVKPLQRDQLVTSRPNPKDVRQLVFSLTSAGRERVTEAIPLWETAQREVENAIGSNRVRRLRRDFRDLTRVG